MQPVLVVPRLNPAKDIQPGLRLGGPASAVYKFALQRGKEAFGHGVVIRIAHRAHGWTDLHLLAALAKGHAGVLTALVAVVNDLLRSSDVQRHIERSNHQVCRHPCPKGPAYDLAAARINDNCQVQETLPCWDICHVGHPQLVDAFSCKAALHQIRSRPVTWVAFGGHHKVPAAAHPLQAHHAQPF